MKYMHVVNALVREIDDRGLEPGDQLGSHADLVQRFGVSRGTITKALSVLETRGLVSSEQGRGTFVRSTVLRPHGSVMRSFSESVVAEGRVPGANTLRISTLNAGDDPLGIDFDPGQPLIELRRVRTVDETVVGIHRVQIPQSLADELAIVDQIEGDPGLSLYGLFRRAAIHFGQATEEIDAVAADDTTATELGVSPGVPLLRVRRYSRDPLGRPVEATEAVYIPDRFHLRASSSPLT